MVWCMDARPKLVYPPVAYVSHSPSTLPPPRSIIKRSDGLADMAMSESDDIEIVEKNIVDAR